MQAYSEQIAAEKVKFDAYESRVKGESAKAGVYDAQARAYASTVQAVASQADIKVKEAQAKTDVHQSSHSKVLGDVDMYKSPSGREPARGAKRHHDVSGGSGSVARQSQCCCF